jgi:large subunit ribosomal protein L17
MYLSFISSLGNPFPSILPQRIDQRNFIHNILLEEAKKAYRAEKYEQITKSLNEQDVVDK